MFASPNTWLIECEYGGKNSHPTDDGFAVIAVDGLVLRQSL